jgi:hypothetical protein
MGWAITSPFWFTTRTWLRPAANAHQQRHGNAEWANARFANPREWIATTFFGFDESSPCATTRFAKGEL